MDRKGVVADFLQRCIGYSDASIARKSERGDVDEIGAWQTYRDFTKHALMEIQAGVLDSWFENEEFENLEEAKRIDADDLSHKQRATWLSGILSPRPLVLASTQNQDGLGNLAPLTSVMSASNSPPLIIASLSQDSTGRLRDTLLNLRTTKKAILHMMPSSLEAAGWVDSAGTPLPQTESEWELTGLKSNDHEPLLINQAVAALEVEFIEELTLPNAVAKLVVLRVTHIWSSLDQAPISGINTLCQHGIDRLTPSPENWSKTVDKHYG